MTRVQVAVLHLSVALTAITGAVFAVMKYWMKSDDPFSVVNHPLQPWMLAAHVVIAPLLVFALGWAFPVHIWPRFTGRRPAHRRSGVGALSTIVPMTLSAYLLQVSTAEGLRKAMAVTHWASSALFVAAYAVHVAIRVTQRPRPGD